MSTATRWRRLLWVLGGLACLVLLGTMVSYDRLVQLYLRHRLEGHPEELRAYAVSNDGNMREAIRLFANTQEGAERIGTAFIQALCDGLSHAQLGLCSRDFGSPEAECDVELILARFPGGGDGFMRMKLTRWWDHNVWEGRVDLKMEALECIATFMLVLCGKQVVTRNDLAEPGVILEVTDFVRQLPHGLIPIVPYCAAMRAEDREKVRRFSEALQDTTRFQWQRCAAAEALGSLRTPEAIAVLERALGLDDLDADIMTAVEKAIDQALANTGRERG